jgi:NAD(P)-dependent dehydrogenase (short-subunit alcohol dehydrogenase family)
MRLKNKMVVVTGAAGSIGREVCQVLANQGASLALTDLASDPLDEITRDLQNKGASIFSKPADSADLSTFERFLNDAETALGRRPNALVNTAGFWRIIDFVATTPGDWQEMLTANLMTVLASCRAIIPRLLESGEGSIVNFASTAGEFGSIRPSAAYAAAKGAVIAFSKSLAREVSPNLVRVNCISPGPIDTPMLQAASDEARSIAASRTLLGRLGTPHDIANGVLFLLSDESAFVTGTVLQVNGGSLL